MQLCPNGLVLVSPEEFEGLYFIHLTSGLDGAEGDAAPQCGSQTSITGYTEWLAQGQHALTLGWDWELSTAQDGSTAPKRLGLPRTNIYLTTAKAHTIEWERNLARLGDWIDRYLAWVPPVIEQLKIESELEN